VLVSGIAIAEATGRRFRMLWPKTLPCPATFQELFTNDFLVEDSDSFTFSGVASVREYRTVMQVESLDLLAEQEDDLYVTAPRWLLQPVLWVSHRAAYARALEILGELKPVASIQHEIDEFRRTLFRTRMIGVHLRRGDFHFYAPESSNNTQNAMIEVDRLLNMHPESGIFLCTDDGDAFANGKKSTRYEGVREKFRRRYGDRVVWTSPRRDETGFVRNAKWALVDLWLLRATDSFVGTPLSSFSEVAHVGRDVEVVLVDGAKVSWRAIEFLMRVTGLYWVLRWYGRRRFGYDMRFSRLLAATMRGIVSVWGRLG
jgi:hypothetical protein